MTCLKLPSMKTDTRKNMIVECTILLIKKIYTQLFKFIFTFRTVASRGRIHKEEG